MKFKLLKITVILLIFIFEWFSTNGSSNFLEERILWELNTASSGYNSILLHAMVYIVLCLLLFADQISINYVLRKSRRKLATRLTFKAMINVLIFTMSFVGISVLFQLYYLGYAYLQAHDFFVITALFVSIMFTYYLIIGMIFTIFQQVFTKTFVSIFLTCSFGLILYILKIMFGIHFLVDDLLVYDNFYKAQIVSNIGYFLLLLRNVLFICGLYMLLLYICKTKDFLGERAND